MPCASVCSTSHPPLGSWSCRSPTAVRGRWLPRWPPVEAVPVAVHGPTGEPVSATLAVRPGGPGRTVVVEMADACGLGRLPDGIPAPLTASSRGLGEAISAALDLRRRGRRRGGWVGQHGRWGGLLGPSGRGCSTPRATICPTVVPRWPAWTGSTFPGSTRGWPAPPSCSRPTSTARCSGRPAPRPSSPRRRAPRRRTSWCSRRPWPTGPTRWRPPSPSRNRPIGHRPGQQPGAGAAGGVGFALLAVLGAERRSGVDVVLDLVGLDAALAGADLLVTGEGSLDEQTLAGKAVSGVARRAQAHGIPAVAVCGKREFRRRRTGGTRCAGGLPVVRPRARPGALHRRRGTTVRHRPAVAEDWLSRAPQ